LFQSSPKVIVRVFSPFSRSEQLSSCGCASWTRDRRFNPATVRVQPPDSAAPLSDEPRSLPQPSPFFLRLFGGPALFKHSSVHFPFPPPGDWLILHGNLYLLRRPPPTPNHAKGCTFRGRPKSPLSPFPPFVPGVICRIISVGFRCVFFFFRRGSHLLLMP